MVATGTKDLASALNKDIKALVQIAPCAPHERPTQEEPVSSKATAVISHRTHNYQ